MEEVTKVRDKEHCQAVNYEDISLEQLCQLREQVLDLDKVSQISDVQSWDDDKFSQI